MSCCGEGGTLQTNITGVCVECSQHLGHIGFVLAHGVCAFPFYTVRLQVALQGNCLKWALSCMHFPGLSHSGTGSCVPHRGLRFVPFPGPRSSSDQVLGERTLPRWGRESYHLPSPSHSLSWVCSRSAVSGVPCVSSGELISGCDPLDGCQLARVPGRLG